MSKKNCKMDPRCPRALKSAPDTWCPLAVLRLKAIRNAGKELSEEEEAKLPGCPWAVNHQLANYCFFKYVSDYSHDKPPSDVEIASLNCVSVETVKKTEKVAINKLKELPELKSIKEIFGDENVVSDTPTDPDYQVNR
jgi:hypothetical protein